MTSEKEFKRENGDTIKVVVSLFVYSHYPDWCCQVWIKHKGKRKYRLAINQNSAELSEINEVKNILIDKLRETITDKID